MTLPRLLLITDRRACTRRSLVEQLRITLAGLPEACAIVQLREKELGGRDLAALAREILGVTRPRRCPLLVNERIDVVMATDADGVHLPDDSYRVEEARTWVGNKLVGVSTHNAEQVQIAANAGANLILLGPIWDTPAKRAYGPPLGLGAVAEAAAVSGAAALYAVGGIQTGVQVHAAIAHGCHGAAFIRSWCSADDPSAVVGEFIQQLPSDCP